MMNLPKKVVVATGLIFLLIAFTVLILSGSSYTFRLPIGSIAQDAGAFQVAVDPENTVVSISEKRVESGHLLLTLRSVSRGKAYLDISGPEGCLRLESIYVHVFGIITVNSFLGNSAGAWIIPLLITLYLLLLLWYAAGRYRAGMKKSFYQYQNIRYLSWIFFLCLILAGQCVYLLAPGSIVDSITVALRSSSSVAYIAFPLAFLLSILVAISNLLLLRREGKTWRNLLGVMLGLLLCLGTLLPFLLSEYLQSSTIIDVHNERGTAHYIELLVTNAMLAAVAYLECILAGTIILSAKAAKRIPAFDKDYMLILGCQLRKDGSLTPLLKGRADRALEFARMQKEGAGRDLIFVPSGGKGSDEVIAEADALKNYLLEQGIPEERILVENTSTSTFENFRNSLSLIQTAEGGSAGRDGAAPTDRCAAGPKIAFATTNYHVFRAGILAREQGADAEGIGSSTRSYFWINAFVREFIATLYAEWKKHLRAILSLLLFVAALVLVVYISAVR